MGRGGRGVQGGAGGQIGDAVVQWRARAISMEQGQQW
jgi:hypothetical protein